MQSSSLLYAREQRRYLHVSVRLDLEIYNQLKQASMKGGEYTPLHSLFAKALESWIDDVESERIATEPSPQTANIVCTTLKVNPELYQRFLVALSKRNYGLSIRIGIRSAHEEAVRRYLQKNEE